MGAAMIKSQALALSRAAQHNAAVAGDHARSYLFDDPGSPFHEESRLWAIEWQERAADDARRARDWRNYAEACPER